MDTLEKAARNDKHRAPTVQLERPASPPPERYAWLAIPLCGLVVGALAVLGCETVWNPPLLLPFLNICFLTCVSLLISILAARSYLSGQPTALLFLGSGALFLGLVGALAALPLAELTPNWRVTLYTFGAALSSICHLAGAVGAYSQGKSRSRSNGSVVTAIYLSVVTSMMILAVIDYEDWLPVFFVDGQGPTFWNLMLLWTTAGLFSLSAILLNTGPDGPRSSFHRWYGQGLGLIAVGLLGVSIQKRLGTPLNWAARSTQYLGGVYMLTAVVSSFRRTGRWTVPLEQALRESEERYQSLVDLSPDAILVHAAGKYIFANPAAARLVGADTPGEIVGRDVMDFVPSDQRTFVAERIAEIYDGAVARLQEATLVCLDGQSVEVEVTASKISFGGKAAIQISLRDITERKRTERQLRELSQRLSYHVDNSPLAVIEWGPDMKLIRWSGEAERMFGWKAEEVLGRRMEDFRWIYEEDISQVAGVSSRLKDGSQPANVSVNRNYRKDGSVVVSEWYNSSMVDASGKLHSILSLVLDVTDRNRAEEAVRDSEARFRLLSETAGRLLSAENPQKVVNELCRQVMEHLDCQVFFNFLVDERAGRLHLNACAGIPEEEAARIEWLDYGVAVCGAVARDGLRIVAHDICNIHDPRTELVKSYGIQAYACHPLLAQGRVIGTLSFGARTRVHFSSQDLDLMRTVTDQVATAMERIRLIEELKKSGAELEMRVQERTRDLLKANAEISDLYNNAPCGYHSLGPDGTFLEINNTELQWLGYTREEVVGKKKWIDLLSPASQKFFHENFHLFTKQGWISDLEYELVRKDGTLLPVLLSATAVKDAEGRYIRSRSTIFDITERREAQEKISRANAMLQMVFDGISDPLLMIDRNSVVRLLNVAACRYFNTARREDAMGKTCRELTAGRCGPCATCAVISGLPEGRRMTFERNGLFDSKRVEQVTVWPVEAIDGEASGVILRIGDITETKNMEKHLTRADRLSSLGQLSGGIAHEIRNPLAGINLFIDVLCDEEKFSRTPLEQEILGEIKASIKRIDGIIKRVLDFSRQSETTSQSNLKLRALLEDTLKLWHARMTKDGIQLEVAVEENVSDVVGDSIEIQQVLTNLIQNALEAMEKKGGTLSIGIQNGMLSFDPKRPAVIVRVRDTGGGIPLDLQESVLNPFFTTKHTGTGLGLAISHRIVSRHGGLLSFESMPEEGATFIVELPAS